MGLSDIVVWCDKEHVAEYQEGVCLLCEVDRLSGPSREEGFSPQTVAMDRLPQAEVRTPTNEEADLLWKWINFEKMLVKGKIRPMYDEALEHDLTYNKALSLRVERKVKSGKVFIPKTQGR